MFCEIEDLLINKKIVSKTGVNNFLIIFFLGEGIVAKTMPNNIFFQGIFPTRSETELLIFFPDPVEEMLHCFIDRGGTGLVIVDKDRKDQQPPFFCNQEPAQCAIVAQCTGLGVDE